MAMQLISEKLLEREIKRLEDAGRPEDEEVVYHLCKKELAVIEKLKINHIDMRGEIEEFNQMIANQEIYFMEQQEFENMEKKAIKYDIISEIIKNDLNVEEVGYYG